MRSYTTAYDRWAGVGPYYAMFPLSFVDEVINLYTCPGDNILDPFAGRASTIFAGASRGRPSYGIEISPVGWIYGKTKLEPAQKCNVLSRLSMVECHSNELPISVGQDLPEFYSICFAPATLRFLIAARQQLDWRNSKTDRTLMTFILIDLHGVRERSFSNQMRQSRAMFPTYSMKWWREHGLTPPEIDPGNFLRKKIKWRYAKGIPDTQDGHIWLGDSTQLMNRFVSEVAGGERRRFSLLFTSPPYMGISDYHRDQWLRMWMLGGQPLPARMPDQHRTNFASEEQYRQLLEDVFNPAAEVIKPSGCVYVRTDARDMTFDITWEVLQQEFPRWRQVVIERPFAKQTQTALFGDKAGKPGERDILLVGPRR